MKAGKKNIKINMKELVLEKKISRKIMPSVLKEIMMGTVSTTELIKFVNKKN